MTTLTYAEWAKTLVRILEREEKELHKKMLAEGWLYCKGPKRRPYYRRGPHFKLWPDFDPDIRTSIPTKHWRKLNARRTF